MTRSQAQASPPNALLAAASPMLRVTGVSTPLVEVVARARAHSRTAALFPPALAPLDPDGGATESSHDYAQIDATLACVGDGNAAPAPQAGLSYAGFTTAQRQAFLAWSLRPTEPAPPAFQQLFLANLEVRLLESVDWALKARRDLQALAAAPAWQRHAGLTRTLLLAFWLAQDGNALAAWQASSSLATPELNAAIGLQTLLGTPLRGEQLPRLLAAWLGAPPELAPSVLALRLNSLTATLGNDPLAHTLQTLGATALLPRPWRCQHRDLRLQLPQPDVRNTLEPLLIDLASVTEPAGDTPTDTVENDVSAAHAADAPAALAVAHIIVEFGHSRSEFFDYALRQARKQDGFAQLMDENRQIVYRVPFRRNELRRFWQIWDSVQGWSSTRIFCQGRELEKWQVYPYSQYLR